jgi:pimeloyl-ACP methyl ester carboxylesterase
MQKLAPSASSGRASPRLRRAYFDCRYGQLHVHNAIPAGGGFDELTTLVCVHGSGETGRVFASVLAELGHERSIYALDLPGCGESDPAPGTAAIEAGVNAVADFLDSMRIRVADLLTHGDGAVIARRLAGDRPAQIRRVAMLAEGRSGTAPVLAQPSLVLDAVQAAAAARNARLAEFFR